MIIIIAILIFGFIGVVLHLSFAGEDPEVKVAGLTFFISLFLVGPLFNGIISIPAPVPMDNENTIEVVSIIVAIVFAAIALGIYKISEEIRYRHRQRKSKKENKKV